MKTKEELNTLKEEVEAVNEKLAELTPEEIAQVSGGGHAIVFYGDLGIGLDAAIQPGIPIDR